MDCDFEEFRRTRYEVAWTPHTRPDVCSSVASFSQITPEVFFRMVIKLTNAAVQKIQQYEERGLLQHSLRKRKTTDKCFI